MMARRSRQTSEGTGEAPNFWASYSDLMASMLLVFVLLLVVALFHFSEHSAHAAERLADQKAMMQTFANVQQQLIAKLQGEVAAESVTLDPQTGALRIGDGILFEEGAAELTGPGRQKLGSLFDAYMRIVLAPEFTPYIKQIEIEGHTNTNGTYLFNLELSQRRALAVMSELLNRSGSDRTRLESLVVASGRSYANLIRDPEGREDPVRSRRIEIKFRLREAELFQELTKNLDR